MAADLLGYSQPGPLTSLSPEQRPLADGVPDDPIEICKVAQSLVIEPRDAIAQGVSEQRATSEKSIRPAWGLIEILSTLDPSPLYQPRPPDRRVVGTCRHFAVLSTALLRLQGIPARARCGFVTYFVPDRSVDHWITEYWGPKDRRWVRVDTEILDQTVITRPDDLSSEQFLTGGEAWSLHRSGSIDPNTFGVAGVAHAWGVGEIRGNAIRDLASLRKLEMLPWDEWGRMDASYKGLTGREYDQLMDRVAEACAGDDPRQVERIYHSEDLAVPEKMIG